MSTLEKREKDVLFHYSDLFIQRGIGDSQLVRYLYSNVNQIKLMLDTCILIHKIEGREGKMWALVAKSIFLKK